MDAPSRAGLVTAWLSLEGAGGILGVLPVLSTGRVPRAGPDPWHPEEMAVGQNAALE